MDCFSKMFSNLTEQCWGCKEYEKCFLFSKARKEKRFNREYEKIKSHQQVARYLEKEYGYKV